MVWTNNTVIIASVTLRGFQPYPTTITTTPVNTLQREGTLFSLKKAPRETRQGFVPQLQGAVVAAWLNSGLSHSSPVGMMVANLYYGSNRKFRGRGNWSPATLLVTIAQGSKDLWTRPWPPLELLEILHKGKLGKEVPVGTEEEKEFFGWGTVLTVAAFFLRLPKPRTLGFHK